MVTRKPTELGELHEHRSMLAERYRVLVSEADRLAGVLGRIVGRVSLTDVGSDIIPVDVPPEVWLELASAMPQVLGRGYYFVVVDPKTRNVVLASVEDVKRLSWARHVNPEEPSPTMPLDRPHPLTEMANLVSLRLELRPVVAARLADPEGLRFAGFSAPTVPPDPGSPVAMPRPETVAALLGLPRPGSGVLLGALGVADQLYRGEGGLVEVWLPWGVLVKHVLITGTTGSGKTSMVKNMLYSLLASRDSEAAALVLDASGDYTVATLPGCVRAKGLEPDVAEVLEHVYRAQRSGEVFIAAPATSSLLVVPCRSCHSVKDAEEATRDALEALGEEAKTIYEKCGCSHEVSGLEEAEADGEPAVWKASVKVKCGRLNVESTVYIAPRIVVLEKPSELGEIDPLMTDRAREALRTLDTPGVSSLENLKQLVLQALETPSKGRAHGSTMESVKGTRKNPLRGLHESTLRSLLARIEAAKNMGMVEFAGSVDRRLSLDPGGLFETAKRLGARLIVVDLGRGLGLEARMVMGSYLLRRLPRQMERGGWPRRLLLVVDEAHLFFPPREEGAYAALLRRSLERLARLGRSRGVGLVLSTHREQDVSAVAQTLANTKVYLRTDPRTAEELRVLPQSYRRLLPSFRDHTAVVYTYAVKGSVVTVVNGPALLGHRTA